MAGLESGADDYISKPFDLPVFLARVRALLRRRKSFLQSTDEKASLQIGDLTIDEARFQVACGEEKIALTRSEFRLLLSLAKNSGKVLTREQLIGTVQGFDVAVTDRTIDTHVFGIRKKLGPCGHYIETIRGVGYRMRET